jgi:hypothetical protein
MENKPRDVYVVIDQILVLIPKEEEKLIQSLKNYLENLLFKPPEYFFTYQAWIPFANILNKNIPNIKEDWQIKIRDIVNC